VAEWLEADPRVSAVHWAGLPSHPHHARAARYLPLGPGSVFAFRLAPTGDRDGREVGRRFIESLQLASHLANVGDARTLVIHPASTTHQQLSAEQLATAGVPEDLVRISVGLEDPEDILWDLDQALRAATAPVAAGAGAGAGAGSNAGSGAGGSRGDGSPAPLVIPPIPSAVDAASCTLPEATR
jgi:O-acetylhomoserine (thiol)-lyase